MVHISLRKFNAVNKKLTGFFKECKDKHSDLSQNKSHKKQGWLSKKNSEEDQIGKSKYVCTLLTQKIFW